MARIQGTVHSIYGVLRRLPHKEFFWLDSRLTHRPHTRPDDGVKVIAILSPEDKQQLSNYDLSNKRLIQLGDLDLTGVLDNTIYKSVQIKLVCYQCSCKIFYYVKPGVDCFDYPKTCPLGHPAYQEF